MFLTRIKSLACTTTALALLTTGISVGFQPLSAAPGPAGPDSEPMAKGTPRTDDYGEPLPHGAVARLGTARFRHSYARFAAFSPDGRTLASLGSTDGKRDDVLLWETATGRQLRRLAPVCMPSDPDYSHYSPLAFSPDGRLLAVGGTTDFNTPNRRRWVELWEVASGKQQRQIPFFRPDSVYSLAFSPDGKTLAVADHSRGIQLVEVASGKQQQRFTLVADWTTRGLRYAPDGTLLAFGTRISTELKREQWEAAQLEVREAATGKVVAQVRNPQPRDIYCRFTFSSDAKTAVICNGSSLVSVWDATTGKQIRKWQSVQSMIHHLALAPDGTTLATLSGNAIQQWNVVTGQRLDRTDAGPGQVVEMALSADGRRLATRSLDHHDRILLWDPAKRQQVSGYQHPEPIHCLALSADGRMLAAGSKGIVLWDAGNQKELGKLPESAWGGSPNHVARGALAFAPDGKTLATVKSLTVWDIARGNKILQLPDLYLNCVAYAPNGKLIAGGGRALKGVDSSWVALWDPTGGELHRFALGGQKVTALAFSADGKTLAAGLEGWREAATLRAWDTTTGRELARFDQRRTSQVTSVNQQGARQYNQPQTIHCLTLSPDGKTIAAVENHHTATVYLWETATGKERGQLRGHEGAVTAVAFFPDGRLASGSLDRTVLMWDLRIDGQANLTADQMETQWSDLAGEDAIRAYQAIHTLGRNPATAVSFLQRLRAVLPAPDANTLAQLIKDLDSPQFATRQKAFVELEKVGNAAGPALKNALEGNPSLEVRRRVEDLLAKAERRALSGEDVRTWRAIEVLEHIGTPEARQVLTKLAAGTRGHPITDEATAALHRLSRMDR